jgi:hypothetical protein
MPPSVPCAGPLTIANARSQDSASLPESVTVTGVSIDVCAEPPAALGAVLVGGGGGDPPSGSKWCQ